MVSSLLESCIVKEIEKAPTKNSLFKHIRFDKNMKVVCLLENSKIIGVLAVETKDDGTKWIQGLEIVKSKQDKGYGKKLLKYAMNKLNAEYLSVRKTNKVAYNMYKNAGWKTYDETDYMFLMTTNKTVKEMTMDRNVYYKESVSSELTEALTFLLKTYDTISDLREDSKLLFKEIDSMEPVGNQSFKKINFGNTYDSKIKKPVDEYKKKVHKILEQLDIDYKLFSVDMKEIYSNRETSEVMHRYTTIQSIYDKYKSLKKKREKSEFIDDVTSRANYYKSNDGFVLYTLMLAIIHSETEIDGVLEKIIKTLSDFVHGKKNKKEEDDD